MRLSNRKKISKYNFIATLLMLFLIAGVLFYIFEEIRLNFFEDKSYLLIVLPIVFIILFFLHGRQVFEYDSDGEALHFRNQQVVPFISKNLSDEFPKYKLISFEVISIFFFRKLYITISSKNKGHTFLKYDISFLTRKEVKDLKLSLNKVVKINNEKSTQQKQ